MPQGSTQERFKRGAADAGKFFNYMASFVDFDPDDTAAMRETRFIIEKHIPDIVAGFYTQLLRFPSTRKLFLNKEGRVDQEYLRMRMHHQANFWRRAAAAEFDEDFARYVDYVGRAHTSQGADSKIYIPERYVIGMVGFVQQRVTEALMEELREIDPDLEMRAAKAWNAFLMVVLELLARAYGVDHGETTFEVQREIDDESVHMLAVDTYERALGIARSVEHKVVLVAPIGEIPEGSRKIIRVDDLSIGVFHHNGEWYALHNSCLHRGGPVCAGTLEGDTLTCPWHGYEYNVTTGEMLLDQTSRLPGYAIEMREGDVYLHIPILVRDALDLNLDDLDGEEVDFQEPEPQLAPNEFRADRLAPGEITQVEVDGEPVAVYNLHGRFFATHDRCTHVGGPLSEGWMDGVNIVCPWHESCFDVTNGAVTCGPAKDAVRTYKVILEDRIGRVE